ncbi:MAG: hypothetical protein ACR2O6_03570 [Ilumatobacteraceae bacterium]
MNRLRTLLIPLAALAMFGAACSDDEGDGAEVAEDVDQVSTEPTVAQEEEVSAGPLRPGLEVTSVDFTTGVAVITNNGDRDIDLTGHWICNRPSYAELPAQTLAPGDTVEASLGGFVADAGEVAIYNSDAFGDPTAIQTYVGWGSGGGRQSVAEEAGIWSGAAVQPAGDKITLTGEPGSAAGWT